MPGFYKLSLDGKHHTTSWFYKTPSDSKWHSVKNVFYKVAADNKWHPMWLYNWDASAWSPCSVSCGGGTQTRTVRCKRSDTLIVHDSFCNSANRPITQQTCNTQSCVTINDSWCSGLNFGLFTSFACQQPGGMRPEFTYVLGSFVNNTGVDQSTLYVDMRFGNYDIKGTVWCDINVNGTGWVAGYSICAGPKSPRGDGKGAVYAQGSAGLWCIFPNERRSGDNYSIWRWIRTFPAGANIQVRMRTGGIGYSGRTFYIHRSGCSSFLWG